MRRFFSCILFLFFLSHFGALAHGDTVVAVQSIRIAPFEAAMDGFRGACGSDIDVKDFFIISEMTDAEVAYEIKRLNPDLLLAVGTASLKRIKSISTVPVVYMMILNPGSLITREVHISGVSIHVPYKVQIEKFLEILPGIEKMGLVFHRKTSAYFVEKAVAAAQAAGIQVLKEEIESSNEGPAKIKSLAPRIDAFWMLPDIKVITPETVDFLLTTSFKRKKPILSFSEKYVKMGALAAVTMDPVDIGKQAGEMAKQVLMPGGKLKKKHVDARKPVIFINSKVAEKFREVGIDVNEEVEGLHKMSD